MEEVQIPMDLHGRYNRPITCQGIGGIRAGGEECAKGGVRLRGPSPWSGEGPERRTERSVWLRQRNAKDPKGEPSVPPGFASGTRKTRKANRAFRLASPAEREREAPPRPGDKALPPCATCAAEGRTLRSRNFGRIGKSPLIPSAFGLPQHPCLTLGTLSPSRSASNRSAPRAIPAHSGRWATARKNCVSAGWAGLPCRRRSRWYRL